jgi:outer membrane protein
MTAFILAVTGVLFLAAAPAGAAPAVSASAAPAGTDAMTAPAETEPGGTQGAPAFLTLSEAVQAALAHFPTVQQSRAEVEAAEAAVTESRSSWIPDLVLRGVASRYEKPSLVYPIHSFTPAEIPPFDRTVFQGGAYLSYTLLDFGGRGSRVKTAREQEEASRASLEGAEQDVVAQVASKYLEALSRHESLEAHDRRLDALRAERDRVSKFERAGRAARVEGLRVEASIAAAEAERVRLAAGLAASERDLTELTGLSQSRTRATNLMTLALADTTIAPQDSLIARALVANTEVRAATRSAAAAQAATGAAKANRYPRLELTGAYQGWTDPDGNSNVEWNAAIQLTQTLFTGGEVSGRVRQATAAGRRAEEGLRLAQISTRREVLRASDHVREADARVRSLLAAVARYEEVVRIEKLALDAGTGVQTDYLNAEADLLTARADLAEAHRAAAVARVELARLTGSLDEAWLSRTLEVQR